MVARHRQLRLSLSHLRAAACLASMVVCALGLWIAMPLLWLYVASLVQGATSSVGAALLTAFAGVAISIPVLVVLLGTLSARLRALVLARRGVDPGAGPLETVMVSSAGLAVVAVTIWFVGWSHSAPLPVPAAS